MLIKWWTLIFSLLNWHDWTRLRVSKSQDDLRLSNFVTTIDSLYESLYSLDGLIYLLSLFWKLNRLWTIRWCRLINSILSPVSEFSFTKYFFILVIWSLFYILFMKENLVRFSNFNIYALKSRNRNSTENCQVRSWFILFTGEGRGRVPGKIARNQITRVASDPFDDCVFTSRKNFRFKMILPSFLLRNTALQISFLGKKIFGERVMLESNY